MSELYQEKLHSAGLFAAVWHNSALFSEWILSALTLLVGQQEEHLACKTSCLCNFQMFSLEVFEGHSLTELNLSQLNKLKCGHG